LNRRRAALAPWLLLAVPWVGACERAPGSGGSAGPSLDAPAASDAAFGTVGDFALVERGGRTITRADLAGRVWICDFFFTTCTGPCPLMGASMHALQQRLACTGVQLVSFSVDPERDTPEALRTYADALGADPERWWFLTGDEETIYRLCRESFALSVERAAPEQFVLGRQIAHATNLIVVDGEGRVRGYYDGQGGDGIERAAARARYLAGARPCSPLPEVNASLNALAAVLLLAGLVAIRSGRRATHGVVMRTAFVVSSAFLACYLYYHFAVTAVVGPTRFRGTGWTRPAYLALLLSHTSLAVVTVPLVLRTLWLAHRERWAAHRRLARWTWPIWMYVSVTGVLVYLALYRWQPSS
jgi:protein SCO1